MFSKIALTTLAVVAFSLNKVNAYTGKASWDALGTTPCPVSCPLSDFRVALPVNLFPDGEHCCETVNVGYNGNSVAVTFTDLYLAGENSFNISLSHQAFAVLSPLEVGQIYPVTWAFST